MAGYCGKTKKEIQLLFHKSCIPIKIDHDAVHVVVLNMAARYNNLLIQIRKNFSKSLGTDRSIFCGLCILVLFRT